MSSAEFYKWKPYFEILFDKRSSTRLQKSVFELCPLNFILAIEELLINIRVSFSIFEKFKSKIYFIFIFRFNFRFIFIFRFNFCSIFIFVVQFSFHFYFLIQFFKKLFFLVHISAQSCPVEQ